MRQELIRFLRGVRRPGDQNAWGTGFVSLEVRIELETQEVTQLIPLLLVQSRFAMEKPFQRASGRADAAAQLAG